ncbi:MAG: SusC/RagA family TonB-linked outer membrane protein [Gemmatimonadota bacterium]|nr:SusC/RagA family TonB-linked outer membrane protein [Gemmatimonadota bacterium]
MMFRAFRRWCLVVAALVAVPAALRAQQATGTITGTVTDAESGAPLAGAQVSIPASRQGALIGAEGKFSIPNVRAGRVTVRAQMIGFEPVTRTVTLAANGSVTVDFQLRRTAVTLTDVVVTATGVERTKEIGTALSAIDSASLARAPVVDLQQALVGRTSGVTVLANSGQPGAGGNIRLRGVNSISQGNAPIVYVDGVRIYNGGTGTSVVGRQETSPLNDIDASDIDHIEVVKGPAATTLYGTEASGGVIQIFTKHGMAGRPQWHAEVTEGMNNMGHVGPKSDATGLFLNKCSGILTNGVGKTFEDATCPKSGSWLRDGAVQRFSANVRGGSADVTYYLGGNINQSLGVLPEGGNRDAGLAGNFSFRPTTGLELGLNSQYTARHVDWVADGNSANGALLNISRGPNTNFKGSGCVDAVDVCITNATLFGVTSYTKQNHYINGFSAKYDAEGPFSARLNVGYDYDDAVLASEYPFGFPRQPLGQLWQTLWNRSLLTTDFAANWKQGFGRDFQTTTSVGGQMFDSRYRNIDLESDYFAGPGIPVLTSGSLRQINAATDQRVINAGFFLQEVIGWRDRLFVTAGLREDGNSAFGKSFGLQTYPKVSVSYVMSEEPWWHVPHVETFKLRGAVGESGKAPGAFDAVRTWDPIAANDGQPAFTPAQVGNADLGPERTRETELGFDLSAFNGWLGVNATYFQQHTYGALIPVQLPPSNGFTQTQLENVGKLQNIGGELTLDAHLLRRANVDWEARLNYTKTESKAVDLGGQSITIQALSDTYVREGYAVPSYFGYKVTNPNAIANPVVDSNAYLGATYPDQIITPSTTLTLWRDWTIDAIGEWQLGGHLLNAVGYQNANLDVWQPCYDVRTKLRAAAGGDASALDGVTALQRAKCTIVSKNRDYSYWVSPANFFKLRSITVTYAIPERISRGLHNASLSLSGTNLWTSTKYDGTDPEVADISTSSFSRRDYYVFPTFRTFTATLRFNF